MKRLSSSLLTIACVISLSHPMANAQENLSSQESDKCTSHSTAENYPEDSGRKATAREKEIIQKGLVDGTIPHIADLGKVNVNKTLTVGKNNEAVYRVPLSGEYADTDYILIHTLNNTIKRVAEVHIEQLNSNDARLQVWVNGKPEYDNVIRESEANYQTRGVRDAWNAFDNCLNHAGVPMAVVTAISIACGLLAPPTAGAGVPPCIIGAAGAFAGTVSFCYARALKAL